MNTAAKINAAAINAAAKNKINSLSREIMKLTVIYSDYAIMQLDFNKAPYQDFESQVIKARGDLLPQQT
ncbi:hypothetical protein [Chromobacterium violaceum]|uniref:hypothetical protein n=1 Tax=Chromobacterium violaceum TaxID=536 RepID=UPI00111C294D|nr:hypothetical protein [Chromobacterium violaceum]